MTKPALRYLAPMLASLVFSGAAAAQGSFSLYG